MTLNVITNTILDATNGKIKVASDDMITAMLNAFLEPILAPIKPPNI
jgi:hypothetical protein